MKLLAFVLFVNLPWLLLASWVGWKWSTPLGWIIASVAIIGTLSLVAFMRGAGGDR